MQTPALPRDAEQQLLPHDEMPVKDFLDFRLPVPLSAISTSDPEDYFSPDNVNCPRSILVYAPFAVPITEKLQGNGSQPVLSRTGPGLKSIHETQNSLPKIATSLITP